ncbi:uncharacterized protein LOC107723392 [Sinocyclocheilus rhinocerous]|uniref:uncharacterized protein LOC107723392 n=1 Tax=Sinocyclocheilus rhinocerous TaxID=307959 RepID=UPI0007B7A8E8|nr:PREDICTED: uncharacterized protein LOC107723392 [Sinocyclocheilus rhinocerous]
MKTHQSRPFLECNKSSHSCFISDFISFSQLESMFRTNDRRHRELYYGGQHLKLEELKWKQIENDYLYRSIPEHPEEVEFQVSYLRHNTNLQGFFGIWDSEGFKKPTCSDSPKRDLVWWSQDVSRGDITIAENEYLDGYIVKPFLHKFTTSPAFLSSSLMGNFRFSMSINELLRSYQQQFCPGQKPSIRIFETVVYKQEVMYSIVIHAPRAHKLFSKYPLLKNTQDAVCAFSENTIIWRPQAMSKTHRFWLSGNMKAIGIPKKARQEYMWDNIGVAFHVPHGEIFHFSREILTKSLRLCEGAQPKINTEEFVKCEFGPIRLE